MTIYHLIIIGAWAAFLLVWFVMAFSAKRTLKSNIFSTASILIRVLFLLVVVVLALIAKRFAPTWEPITITNTVNPVIGSVGALLVVCGIAFAIWARLYLGRNWGMPMSVKEKPELVTSGPYRFVRHPIYTGVLSALLGSAMVVGSWWYLVFAAGCSYFLVSARNEEKLLKSEFPETYPSYMARSKMLIPFIL